MDFENGDKVYSGSMFVGVWIGNNPITGLEVVYKEEGNEYKDFRGSQILKYPCASVSVNISNLVNSTT